MPDPELRRRKKGKRPVVIVEPVAKLAAAAKRELATDAERIAPFRGAVSAQLDWA